MDKAREVSERQQLCPLCHLPIVPAKINGSDKKKTDDDDDDGTEHNTYICAYRMVLNLNID